MDRSVNYSRKCRYYMNQSIKENSISRFLISGEAHREAIITSSVSWLASMSIKSLRGTSEGPIRPGTETHSLTVGELIPRPIPLWSLLAPLSDGILIFPVNEGLPPPLMGSVKRPLLTYFGDMVSEAWWYFQPHCWLARIALNPHPMAAF